MTYGVTVEIEKNCQKSTEIHKNRLKFKLTEIHKNEIQQSRLKSTKNRLMLTDIDRNRYNLPMVNCNSSGIAQV